MNSWKCSNCNCQIEAKEPPEKCPSCDHECEFVDVTNYVPKMERTGRECKCEVCGTEVKITNDGGGFIKCCDQLMQLK